MLLKILIYIQKLKSPSIDWISIINKVKPDLENFEFYVEKRFGKMIRVNRNNVLEKDVNDNKIIALIITKNNISKNKEELLKISNLLKSKHDLDSHILINRTRPFIGYYIRIS